MKIKQRTNFVYLNAYKIKPTWLCDKPITVVLSLKQQMGFGKGQTEKLCGKSLHFYSAYSWLVYSFILKCFMHYQLFFMHMF